MRMFALTTLTMIAFAANSVLNRLGVGGGMIDPVGFALVRLLAGAAALAVLVAMRRKPGSGAVFARASRRAIGAAALLVYLFGFSLAYGALDAGAGALILFGLVQITMFAGAVIAREPVPMRRWAGAVVAFGGLAVLLMPGGGGGVALGWHAAAMAVAGIGWGAYSLAGRGEPDALAATAANFIVAAPIGLVLALALPGVLHLTLAGVAAAAVSGAVASGLGYALWYALLPGLGAARAAVAQLSVPLLAAAAGALMLAEPLSWRFAAAAALVLGGVALAALPRKTR